MCGHRVDEHVLGVTRVLDVDLQPARAHEARVLVVVAVSLEQVAAAGRRRGLVREVDVDPVGVDLDALAELVEPFELAVEVDLDIHEARRPGQAQTSARFHAERRAEQRAVVEVGEQHPVLGGRQPDELLGVVELEPVGQLLPGGRREVPADPQARRLGVRRDAAVAWVDAQGRALVGRLARDRLTVVGDDVDARDPGHRRQGAQRGRCRGRAARTVRGGDGGPDRRDSRWRRGQRERGLAQAVLGPGGDHCLAEEQVHRSSRPGRRHHRGRDDRVPRLGLCGHGQIDLLQHATHRDPSRSPGSGLPGSGCEHPHPDPRRAHRGNPETEGAVRASASSVDRAPRAVAAAHLQPDLPPGRRGRSAAQPWPLADHGRGGVQHEGPRRRRGAGRAARRVVPDALPDELPDDRGRGSAVVGAARAPRTSAEPVRKPTSARGTPRTNSSSLLSSPRKGSA